MTDSEATLIAAVIAAVVAGAGLAWSIVAFFLTRRSQRATDARAQWTQRFEQAHALALSTDAREARTGLMLIAALTKEEWVTDEDRATAVSVLSSLSAAEGTPAEHLRTSILADIRDRDVAAELAQAPTGQKGRFELFRDGTGGHRWRLRSGSGEVLATSDASSTREAALRSLQQARRTLGGGEAIPVEQD